MGKLSMHSVGKILLVAGMAGLAVGLPVYGWMVRNDASAFDQQVGWANIWAATIGGIGVILMIIDRGRVDEDTQVRQHLIDIAKAQRLRYGRELAELLGTDTLEARSADVRYSLVDPRTGKAKKGSRTVGKIGNIADYYHKQASGRMLILGPAGAGKTVLATTLSLRITEQFLNPSHPVEGIAVPVIFNLTAWPNKPDLTNWLAEDLSLRFRIRSKTARRLVEDGHILPVLDGLDEMDSEGDPPVRAESTIGKINDFIATNPSRGLIVVGRSGPDYYSRFRSKLRNIQAVLIHTLSTSDVDRYIEEHCGEETLEAVRNKFEGSPRRARTLFYSDSATPWRLTMMAAYLNSGGELEQLFPREGESSSQYKDRRSIVMYESFLDARLKNHGYQREDERKIARDYLSIIAHFCSISRAESSGTDIVLHDWWLRFGRGRVKGWQSRLAVAAAMAPFAISVDTPLSDYEPRDGAGWLTWAMPLGNLLMLVSIAVTTPYRAASRPLRISFPRLTIGVLFRVTIYIACAIGLGYMYASIANVALGICAGAGLLLMATIIRVFLADATEDATSPQAPIRRDFVGCIMIGLGFGVFMGAYMAELMGAEDGLRFGLGYFFVALAVFTSGRYFISSLLGPTVGLPVRLAHFLDRATSAGLLRVSGIGYQFRHRELMDYLIISSPPPRKPPIPGPLGIPLWKQHRWWPKVESE
ncbi:NACHT domain-containing protein [Actinoplanes siamensis]|uniref:NACHT domain-containing protein n=1 Tax=Actinoplanes siamensis TaxID=1223317 RepID=UPI00194550E4|nr:NACHT domain-containing protein [Actinoplanes siamensis]